MMDELTVISYNVRGLRDHTKRCEMFNYIREKGADIILLQETHCTKSRQTQWHNEWGGQIIFCNGTSNARGVCILARRGAEIQLKNIQKDNNGRYICCEVVQEKNKYLVVNSYAPNHDDPMFFADVIIRVESYDTGKLIMGGDFNLVMDVHQDRLGSEANHIEALGNIETFMQENYVTDVWRYNNPDKKRYTWRRNRPNISASRIDIFLISNGLLGNRY